MSCCKGKVCLLVQADYKIKLIKAFKGYQPGTAEAEALTNSIGRAQKQFLLNNKYAEVVHEN